MVFSDDHPLWAFKLYKSERYFDTELVGGTWDNNGAPVYVPCFRRPLQHLLNPLIEAGFVVDHILEPLPTEEFKKVDPRHHERLMKFPEFICVRARKP